MFFALLIPSLWHFAACQPGGAIKFLGIPTWYEFLNDKVVAGKCTIDMAFPADIGKILLAIADIAIRIGALVAVGFVIYGGFRFILSQGEPDKAAAARRTILNALIGLVIAVLATTIVTFIGGSLT